MELYRVPAAQGLHQTRRHRTTATQQIIMHRITAVEQEQHKTAATQQIIQHRQETTTAAEHHRQACHNTTAGSATMVNGGITEQEAKNIAAGNAGVTEEQIQYITVKQDWDDGRARYEVEFTAAGVEYDYELDASDGRILSADSEVIDKGYRASQNGTTGSKNATGTSQTAPGGVSIETAKQTVMDRIPGIDAANIYIHPDYDDGISLYEGEAYYAEVKYEFEINAENGNIISWEAESIYD